MALFIDFNSNVFSALYSFHKNNKVLTEKDIRYTTISALKNSISKFKHDYGQIIIACDSSNYWRKDEYVYYKYNRKNIRDESLLNWEFIFEVINPLKVEIKNNFPYKFLEIDKCEADDIIGILAPILSNNENVLIVSTDKDFIQLQKYDNIKQYNTVLGVYVTSLNPERDLKTKIIKGDRKDFIPSFLSEDNRFLTGIRQKNISQKNLDIWLNQEPEIFCENDEILNQYKRNEKLIDFLFIPDIIRDKVIMEFEKCKRNSKQKLYKYFIEKDMIEFLENIDEF